MHIIQESGNGTFSRNDVMQPPAQRRFDYLKSNEKPWRWFADSDNIAQKVMVEIDMG